MKFTCVLVAILVALSLAVSTGKIFKQLIWIFFKTNFITFCLLRFLDAHYGHHGMGWGGSGWGGGGRWGGSGWGGGWRGN
jgi:hypothetical protein